MTRGDIIGGLKIALSKGEKLQSAMQSFYNAGYKKEDILGAARSLKTYGFVPKVAKQPLPKNPSLGVQKQTTKIPIQPLKPKVISPAKPREISKPNIPVPPSPVSVQPKQTQNAVSTQKQMPKQTVSAYAQAPKKKIDFMTILLGVILLLLVGVLVGVFFFKEEIIEFLTKILE